MNRNYEIVDGMYLVQGHYELDLHNNFDFKSFEYSLSERKLALNFERSSGNWVKLDTPKELIIEFKGVSEFRFLPRDSEKPFTEDDCICHFGHLVNEDWAQGVIMLNANQIADPTWLAAVEFMSGAILAVQAKVSIATVSA